jgi:endonuclease/exonuclease/phosphatase family metal-dependent hydrolase
MSSEMTRILQGISGGMSNRKASAIGLVGIAAGILMAAIQGADLPPPRSWQQPAPRPGADRHEQAAPSVVHVRPTGPPLLTWDELQQLYRQNLPPAPLQEKLNRLLTTPFVWNGVSAAGIRPRKLSSGKIGDFMRAVEWNIERGLEFDAVRAAFTDPRKFSSVMEEKQSKADAAGRARILDQARLLKEADLIIFNEVDWGVNRTLFRNVAADLAQTLQMNYAYGVEFVEVDPITMGLEDQIVIQEVEGTYAQPGESKVEMIEHVKKIMRPDPERYHGLHGSATLSRYPLENVRVVPFKFQGHDWYTDEKKNKTRLQKGEGKVSMAVFKEQLVRQVRRGGRMMLIADIVGTELPSGRVTVVGTHIEDVTTPENRQKQLIEMLEQVRSLRHPVIIAGDMNTSSHDSTPISVQRALKQRFGSGRWWAEKGVGEVISHATPFGWAYDVSKGVIGITHTVDDPTARNIPLVGMNREAGFFSILDGFRFSDGSAFDLRGDSEHSSNGLTGRLANSNERARKGFVPTNELGRSFGVAGQYKLDWILVRPVGLTNPLAANQPYHFAPCFGRTLKELNLSIPDRISDHNPITVDLPLTAR